MTSTSTLKRREHSRSQQALNTSNGSVRLNRWFDTSRHDAAEQLSQELSEVVARQRLSEPSVNPSLEGLESVESVSLSSGKHSGGSPKGPPAGATNKLEEFRQLYSAQAEFVRRAVVRLGGPQADVQDLVQEVFVIAFRRWPSEERVRLPRQWLHSIAIRVVAGARRRARVREAITWASSSIEDPVDTPHDALSLRQEVELVYRVLDKLPERFRTVFILSEIEQLPGNHIAALLSVPGTTVRTRLFRARKAFSATMERLRYAKDNER